MVRIQARTLLNYIYFFYLHTSSQPFLYTPLFVAWNYCKGQMDLGGVSQVLQMVSGTAFVCTILKHKNQASKRKKRVACKTHIYFVLRVES